MTTIETKLFGEDARRIEKYLGLNRNGDKAEVDTKIFFIKQFVNGRSKIVMEFDI